MWLIYDSLVTLVVAFGFLYQNFGRWWGITNDFFAQKWIQPKWWGQSFFKKNLGGHRSPFCGATDTPILDFWWHLLWVSKPPWAVLFVFGRCVNVTCSLKFTSSMTPADLLVASMATEPFSSTYLQGGNGGTQNLRSLMPATHSVRPGTQMPYQLSYGTPDPYFLLTEKNCPFRQLGRKNFGHEPLPSHSCQWATWWNLNYYLIF